MTLQSWKTEVLVAIGVVLVILALTDRSALLSGKLSAQQWMDIAKYLGGAVLVAIFLRKRSDAND